MAGSADPGHFECIADALECIDPREIEEQTKAPAKQREQQQSSPGEAEVANHDRPQLDTDRTSRLARQRQCVGMKTQRLERATAEQQNQKTGKDQG